MIHICWEHREINIGLWGCSKCQKERMQKFIQKHSEELATKIREASSKAMDEKNDTP